eukprot:1179164-Prorocentrum_minimum.AAC.1
MAQLMPAYAGGGVGGRGRHAGFHPSSPNSPKRPRSPPKRAKRAASAGGRRGEKSPTTADWSPSTPRTQPPRKWETGCLRPCPPGGARLVTSIRVDVTASCGRYAGWRRCRGPARRTRCGCLRPRQPGSGAAPPSAWRCPPSAGTPPAVRTCSSTRWTCGPTFGWRRGSRCALRPCYAAPPPKNLVPPPNIPNVCGSCRALVKRLHHWRIQFSPQIWIHLSASLALDKGPSSDCLARLATLGGELNAPVLERLNKGVACT